MQWLNEPPSWQADGDAITAVAGPRTDFWRKTHDGGIRHNGHFYYQPVTGDLAAEVRLSAQYAALYDQAGLMVRLDEANWLKCGIELVDGVQYASTVVTRDWSDWSVLRLGSPAAVWFRLTRRGPTIETHYSLDGEAYSILRQAHLTLEPTLQVGIMLASPTGDGFPATFEGLTVGGLALPS